VHRGGRVTTVNSCIKKSKLWNGFNTHKLKTNHRLDENELQHAKWLIQLGDGTLPQEPGVPQDYVKIPDDMLTDSVIDDLYPKEFYPEDAKKFSERAILCPLNEQCVRLNNEIIGRIKSESKTYLSIDTIVSDYSLTL